MLVPRPSYACFSLFRTLEVWGGTHASHPVALLEGGGALLCKPAELSLPYIAATPTPCRVTWDSSNSLATTGGPCKFEYQVSNMLEPDRIELTLEDTPGRYLAAARHQGTTERPARERPQADVLTKLLALVPDRLVGADGNRHVQRGRQQQGGCAEESGMRGGRSQGECRREGGSETGGMGEA